MGLDPLVGEGQSDQARKGLGCHILALTEPGALSHLSPVISSSVAPEGMACGESGNQSQTGFFTEYRVQYRVPTFGHKNSTALEM